MNLRRTAAGVVLLIALNTAGVSVCEFLCLNGEGPAAPLAGGGAAGGCHVGSEAVTSTPESDAALGTPQLPSCAHESAPRLEGLPVSKGLRGSEWTLAAAAPVLHSVPAVVFPVVQAPGGPPGRLRSSATVLRI